MKKIVPFKKELTFKTKVSEITSISLEHKILKKEEDLVTGEFIINGDYKMTEGSINREKYEFKLPFDIALNSKYDVDNLNIDIDNFYYEILNNDTLKVNIDLFLEGPEKEIRQKPEEPQNIHEEKLPEEEPPQVELPEEKEIPLEKENKMENVITKENPNREEEKIEINNENINTNTNTDNNIEINNIFNTDSANETYATYYVYMVKEDDTIDKILTKYNITKEDLETYNNIESIKPYDKIIIPTNGK